MKRFLVSLFIALFTTCTVAQVPIYTRPAAASGIASITGGSITGVTGVATNLGGSGIPIIGLSTGSVAANGAISGITALPLVYPAAYCYFPANALATAIAAGFYYCTFSTTTAGTAFLNQWSSGLPVIPSSPTPVTDGKGAYTGDTTEEFMPSIAIPALGVNSQLYVDTTIVATNSAGSKSVKFRHSGSGGTILFTNAITTAQSQRLLGVSANAGSTSSQSVSFFTVNQAGAAFNGTPAIPTVNTSAATTGVLSLQRGTATDNIILFAWSIGLSL